jgi:general secretion pathway protein L
LASRADTLLAPIRAAAERAGLGESFRWWIGELAAMVPPGWRERLASGRAALVAAEGDEWRTMRVGAGGLVETGRANLASLDVVARRAAFLRLVEGGPGSAGNVWFVLAPELALVRSVVLPLAAEESLRDAVGFELDRLTPFSSEQACFDFRVTGRDTATQRLSLDLAVASRAAVDARLSELREMGATVLGVGIAGDLAASAAPFNLLPAERRERPATSRATLVARTLAGVAGALALFAVLFPLWQKREAFIDLQPRLDKAKAGADVADRLAKEIEKLASEHNFLVAKKQAQYPAVSLLEDLSRLLPDTTWVQQLDMKSGPKVRELQISGETGSSSQLVEIIEKSGSLVNASFKSPLTKGVTPNTERFLLAAEVKPRTLPDPLPESSLLSPTPTAAAPAVSSSGPQPAPVAPSAGAAPAAVAQPAASGAAPSSAPAPAAAGAPPSKPAVPAPASPPAALPAKSGGATTPAKAADSAPAKPAPKG